MTTRQLHAKYCIATQELVLHLSNNTNFWHKIGYITVTVIHEHTVLDGGNINNHSPSPQTQTSSAPELLESNKRTPAQLLQSPSAPSPAWHPPEIGRNHKISD